MLLFPVDISNSQLDGLTQLRHSAARKDLKSRLIASFGSNVKLYPGSNVKLYPTLHVVEHFKGLTVLRPKDSKTGIAGRNTASLTLYSHPCTFVGSPIYGYPGSVADELHLTRSRVRRQEAALAPTVRKGSMQGEEGACSLVATPISTQALSALLTPLSDRNLLMCRAALEHYMGSLPWKDVQRKQCVEVLHRLVGG